MAQAAVSGQDLRRIVDSTLSSFEQFRIKRRNLRFPDIPAIGGGGFGRVHRASLGTWVVGGPTETVVVKKLYARDKSFLSISVALAREVAVWAPLNHPNLLPFVGFHLDIKKEEAWLVSSYAENGTVLDYIHERQPDSRERVEIATDTIQGLHYLHMCEPPVCHGDIKPVNVLINRLGRAILCDFGLAQNLGGPTGLTTTDFRNAATPRYQSPEIFRGQPRSLQGDIWAWGCLVLELLSGLTPYQYANTDLEVLNLLHGENPPAHLSNIELSPSIQELLAGCWAVDPGLRPSSQSCLDVLTASDKEAFRQKSLWASPAVVDILRHDLDDALRFLDRIRLRRSIITLSPDDAIKWGAVRPGKMGKGIRSPGTDVAVKILRVIGAKASCVRMLIAVIRELRVWSTLSHPNILPLVGFYLRDSLEEAWFVSTLMPHGNIMMYLDKTNPKSERRLELIKEVANGLAYLHSLEPPVCHGDIKPSNILINEDHHALLCDFGLARSMEGLQTGLTTSTFDQCRSIAYHSPELFMGKSRRTPASDMWAFGCVAHEILSGRSPYFDVTNQAEIVDRIVRGDYPNDVQDHSIPVQFKPVLVGCWQTKPESRFTPALCCSVLDSSYRYLIDRSLITNPKSEAGVEWTTSSAVLTLLRGSREVIVRRVRIPNEKRDLVDVFHRLNIWIEMQDGGYCVQRVQGICLSEFPNYFWLILDHLPWGDVMPYARHSSMKDRLQLVYSMTHYLNILHTQSPPFYHGRLTPRYLLIYNPSITCICPPDFLPRCIDTDTREDVAYCSPEAIDRSELTLASDVWSWACVVQEVLSGIPPYNGVTDPAAVKNLIRQGVPPADIEDLDIPIALKDVIRASWARDPGARPLMSTYLDGAREGYYST